MIQIFLKIHSVYLYIHCVFIKPIVSQINLIGIVQGFNLWTAFQHRFHRRSTITKRISCKAMWGFLMGCSYIKRANVKHFDTFQLILQVRIETIKVQRYVTYNQITSSQCFWYLFHVIWIFALLKIKKRVSQDENFEVSLQQCSWSCKLVK